MNKTGWQFGLPLLAKELVELSAKRRTYVLRLVYGSLLFVIAYFQYGNILMRNSNNPFSVLGHGKEMFEQLVWLQFGGIYIFMPAMACGAITQEKERNSLGLLLITRLSPTTILFEKLVSRLIPMFTFLLLSLPLLAFAYSLGGVTQIQLWGSCLLLSLTCIQVATFALMCSAFCGTSISAFFSTYLGGLILLILLGCCAGGISRIDVTAIAVYAFLLLFSSGVFFAIALGMLVDRALIPPRNLLLEFFKGLDRFFTSLNNATTGGVILIRDSVSLPNAEPIAWRETAKKSLGTARYLIRVFVSIETPLALILAMTVVLSGSLRSPIVEGLLYVVWVIAILFVTVKTSSLIATERTAQTLEVLLATPLTGEEIIVQKFRGVWRLIIVLAMPILTVVLFEAWWEVNETQSMQSVAYLLGSLLSLIVYLPLFAWISVLIGLQLRSQSRATLIVLFVIFGWILLPWFLGTAFIRVGGWPPLGAAYAGNLFAVLISPASLIFLNEDQKAGIGLIILNFTFYSFLLWIIYRWCTRRADEYLGRCGSRAESRRSWTKPIDVMEAAEG